MAVARGVGLALGLAPAAAGGVLGLPRLRHLAFRRRHGLPPRVEIGARDAQLGLDVGEPVAAGEPARRRGRRVGGDGEAVPAPQIALLRHQPLAGLELVRRGAAPSARATTPIWASRRAIASGAAVMKVVSGTTPSGSAGSATSTGRAAPVHRRGRLDRRVEIVAERGAERGLVALLDGEQVDHRRPHLLVLDVQQAGERLRLGFEPVGVALGLGERLARDVERLAGRRLRRLGAQRIGLGGGDRFLCGRRRGGEAVEIDRAGGIGDELFELGGDLAVLALELGAALVAAAHRGVELTALCA